jgi:hypothetical protein
MSWLYQENNCIYSLNQCFWTLIIQAIAWMLAAVYFDNVQPNRHGVRLSYLYPLKPSYWLYLFRSGSASSSSSSSRSGAAGASHGSGKQLTPFAAPDAARKVAKAISEVKEDEQLVIRCTSSAGGAGPDAIAARGLAGGVAAQGSMASTARHSVSSGMLRRRDNRQSDPAGSSGRDSYPGELVTLPSRSQAAGAVGRVPQHSGSQHSTQLLINPSVTAMRLSDASSAEAHAGVVHVGPAAGADGTAAPGTTITLQQYQQLQVESSRRAAASKRWWEFWRYASEDSSSLSAKKLDSMVAAGAGAAVSQSKEAAGAYGVTPVVLDAGVLQEEQRMKAVLFGGERGCLSDCTQHHSLHNCGSVSLTEDAMWGFLLT